MQFGGPSMYAAKPAYYGNAHRGFDAYNTMGSGWGGQHASPFSAFGQEKPRKKRMNVFAMAMNVFVPWLVFCLIAAMLSFDMHYRQPALCQVVIAVAITCFAVFAVADLFFVCRKTFVMEAGPSFSSWLLFLCISCLLATIIGVGVGNRNFWANTEPFYDVTALNSYDAVDPSKMRGQELMDAGQITFVKGAHLDLTKAMGFRNVDNFCVAPITVSMEGAENAPLASYDFWAVGKDCCSGANTAVTDFRCGEYNNPNARGGVRLVRDEERAFFRLAVQQAQSTHEIKAIHPLFFHWVADPETTTYSYQREAFKHYIVAMFAYMAGQLMLVAFVSSIFAKCNRF